MNSKERPRVIAQATSNGEPIWVFPRTREVYTKMLSQVAYDLHSRLGMSAGDAMAVSAHALASVGIHIESMRKDNENGEKIYG